MWWSGLPKPRGLDYTVHPAICEHVCALSRGQHRGHTSTLPDWRGNFGWRRDLESRPLRPGFLEPKVVTVRVDLQNALNLSDRTAIARAVSDKLPSL